MVAIRPRRNSFTATVSGTAPTCSAPAWRRSGMSAASTCKTSIAGKITVAKLQQGELPLGRALKVEPDQLLRREMMLQLKTGRLHADYFRGKFGKDILSAFADGFGQLQNDRFLTVANGDVGIDAGRLAASGPSIAGVF